MQERFSCAQLEVVGTEKLVASVEGVSCVTVLGVCLASHKIGELKVGSTGSRKLAAIDQVLITLGQFFKGGGLASQLLVEEVVSQSSVVT